MLADDPKVFIDQTCERAKLPTIKEIPVTTPETLTRRFIAEFLTHTTGRLEQWYALNGYLDTSGIRTLDYLARSQRHFESYF